MKPNEVLAASARRAAISLLVAFTALCALPAGAGDRAGFEILGFSPDGRYFAFEEFGIQDGSGFPYANIHGLDLDEDSWIDGFPFRARLDDEAASLSQARAEAHRNAQSLIDRYDLTNPADILALAGDGQEPARSFTFGLPGFGLDAPRQPVRLRLETFPLGTAEPCQELLSEKAKGFALILEQNGTEHEITRDEALPRSRGCPMDYRLFAVLIPFGAQDFRRAVVIVSVYPFGFEGPDRRFISLPLEKGR